MHGPHWLLNKLQTGTPKMPLCSISTFIVTTHEQTFQAVTQLGEPPASWCFCCSSIAIIVFTVQFVQLLN